MMKCVFVCVCVSQKIITSHFRAERRRREVSSPLGRLWPSYDDDGGGDIYIMMSVCLCVTKNHHFLKRPVCLFVMFYPHFFKIRN